MKVAIYVRVSTTEQVEEGYSIQYQKEKLVSFCKIKDWIVSELYIDDGYSGANLDRPGMQSIIKNIKNFNIVLVYRLDRLSRSQKDTLYLVEDVFLKNNVDFVSISESFDTSTPFGRASIGILSVFAQLERETIKERTYLGRVERAKEGLYHGGFGPPIGYDYIDGKLVINEYEAMQVRELFDLYLQGWGAIKIGHHFHEKKYTTKYGSWQRNKSFFRVLSNITYTGKIPYKDGIYDGQHEAIVTEEEYNRVQQIRTSRHTRNYKDYDSPFLLAGLIYCGCCGARYYTRSGGAKKQKYYVCYSASKLPNMVKDPNCKNKSWRIEKLEKEVENLLLNFTIKKKKVIKRIEYSKKDSVLKNRIAELDKAINKAMNLYIYQDDIPVSVINEKVNTLYIEKKALEKELQSIEVKEKKDINFQEAEEALKTVKSSWFSCSTQKKKLLLQSLIKKIEIYEENFTVQWVTD